MRTNAKILKAKLLAKVLPAPFIPTDTDEAKLRKSAREAKKAAKAKEKLAKEEEKLAKEALEGKNKKGTSAKKSKAKAVKSKQDPKPAAADVMPNQAAADSPSQTVNKKRDRSIGNDTEPDSDTSTAGSRPSRRLVRVTSEFTPYEMSSDTSKPSNLMNILRQPPKQSVQPRKKKATRFGKPVNFLYSEGQTHIDRYTISKSSSSRKDADKGSADTPSSKRNVGASCSSDTSIRIDDAAGGPADTNSSSQVNDEATSSQKMYDSNIADVCTPRSHRRLHSFSPSRRVPKASTEEENDVSPVPASKKPKTKPKSTSGTRRKRDISPVPPSGHPLFSRNTELTIHDQRVLSRNKPGDKQAWRRAYLPQRTPPLDTSSQAMLVPAELPMDMSRLFYQECLECKEPVKLKWEGTGNNRYFIFECSKCGCKATNKPKRSINHLGKEGPLIRDLTSVYECLTYNIGYDAYSLGMNAVGVRGMSQDTFSSLKPDVYNRYDAFFNELKE